MSTPSSLILGFAAFSGTGKTTLLVQLLPLLKQRGLRVGVIKHSHHDFEIDQPGKDSHRLRMAGGTPVLLVSPHRRAIISEFEPRQAIDLATQLDYFPSRDVDLILVEGFRHEPYPKIELHRPSLGKPLLYPDDHSIIAVASDQALTPLRDIRLLDLNTPAAIADFVIDYFLSTQMNDVCYIPANGLLTVEQARQAILTAVQTIDDHEVVELNDALGRVLDQDLISGIAIPPHRNAAMDGYAFASADIDTQQKTVLQVVGCAWAGKPFEDEVQSGQCVRILTGAVVPDFADSVIAQEQVERQNDQIVLPPSPALYGNIRAAGSDVAHGETIIRAGKRLSAIDLGLIASAGIARLPVKRRLRIGFFSTGDELVALSQTLDAGQIYDSNRYLLAGLLQDSNHELTDLGVIADDFTAIQQVLRQGADAFDMLISSGGASVGDADFIRQALEACGQIDFWKLAIKPGKPLAFGKIGHCWYFGLPGNPVAVSVTFRQFVQPALQRLLGQALARPIQLLARCTQKLRKTPGRQEYQRGLLQQTAPGEFVVSLPGGQDSHQQKTASLANCYIILDADCAGVEAGSLVMVEPWDNLLACPA